MQYRNGFYLPTDKGSLSVRGAGYIEVESDTIRLNVRITTQNKSLEEAKDENSKISEKILVSLYDYKIPKDNIHSQDISVTRNYDYTNNVFVSYNVSHLISIIIDDFSKLNDIYSLVIENGANDEINVDFILSNPTYHYNKALKKATQDAIYKASLLAKNFGVKYTPTPYKIIENSSSLYAITYSSSVDYNPTQNIAPGIVKITAEVEAKFVTFPV